MDYGGSWFRKYKTGVDKLAAYAAVGRSFGGIGNQHAKVVHTDQGTVVGSTNLTTSSRGNHEVAVHLNLKPGAMRSFRYELGAYISSGTPLEAAEKGYNIRRYFGRRSQSQRPTRPRLALDEAVPGGYASD